VRSSIVFVITAVTILGGCSGVQSAGGGQPTATPTGTTTVTVDDVGGTETADGGKPEALVDISLEWLEKPQDIDSTGELQITVQAGRTIRNETLHVNVSGGVELVSEMSEQALSLEKGESLTTTIAVRRTESGLGQIHVYSSNLLEGDEGTLRTSEVLTIGSQGDESNKHSVTAINRTTSADS